MRFLLARLDKKINTFLSVLDMTTAVLKQRLEMGRTISQVAKYASQQL